MLHRMMAVAFLAGATATLSAQSTAPSFEMYGLSSTSSAGTPEMVTGDFHNDGKLDVVYVGNGQSQTAITMLTGNGDGTFQAPQTVATPSSEATDLAAADINGDGNLDLLAMVDGSVEVFYGNGNGTFQAGLVYATAAYGDTVTTGNFFNDGYTDVAVGDENGNVELFKNVDGKSLVLASTVTIGGGSAQFVTTVRAGNLDGNGESDLGVLTDPIYSTGSNVYAVWNEGNGTFTPAKLASYPLPYGLTVGSANGSGIDDIVLSYNCEPGDTSTVGKSPYAFCTGIDVFYGEGDQTLIQRTAVTDTDDLAGNPVWPIDVNGDGIIDLVSAGAHGQSDGYAGLMVWLGNANGTFQQTPQYYYSDTDGGGPLVPGDWARSGMMGFLMLGGNGAEVWINSGNRAACGTYTVSPSVTACQPVDNTYSPSPVTVEANSYDTTSVTQMQEYVDGTLKYSEPVTSFDTTFTTTPGTHLFVTKGWDASGRSFVADRTVTVFNGTPYPTCPAAVGTANICLPSGTSSSSPVHILANGATDVIPASAQLYIDGDLVVSNTTGATSYVDTTQDLSAGSHTLVFKMWDGSGNVYQATKTITVN